MKKVFKLFERSNLKACNFIISLLLTIFCTSTIMAKGQGEAGGNFTDSNSSTARGMDITARGGVGRREAAPSGPMYMGDGGSNIRLAVLAPEVQGDVPDYLPLYVQGLLNNNINKFSKVNLIDRQNLNRIIAEQNLAANGRFSDNDFVSIGKLTNTQYFLFGSIQKLPRNRYSIQLSVTEASTGVRKATFMKDADVVQFEGSGAVLNEATAELLEQLGVQFTQAGKKALLAGNTSTVLAETGLAKGITAQAGGAEVAALFNFAQAYTFDPTQLEALSLLNNLSTNISGGTISQRIVNDIQARDRWLEVFKETIKFFNDHPPFEVIFDPSLIQIGETDYTKRTATLGMRIALDPSKAGFDALNTLQEGLNKTGKRNDWGFSNWPLTDINPKTAGTVLFNGKQSFSCKVDVTLINEKNKNIGNSSITLSTETMRLSSTGVLIPTSIIKTVNFPNVRVEDLTPVLTISITAVNGIRAQNLNASGYMKIETGDLERVTVDLDNIFFHSIESVQFSPDGNQILSRDYYNVIKIWDIITGNEIKKFDGIEVDYSYDSRQMAISSENTIIVYDVATWREIKTIQATRDKNYISFVKFSSDGKQIISYDYSTVKFWDVATGRNTKSLLLSSFSGNELMDIRHEMIVFRSFDEKENLLLWNTDTNSIIMRYKGHSDFIRCAAFSNYYYNQIISGSYDKTIKLWDTNTGRNIRTFSGHTGLVESVAFSPDNKQIVSGSYDNTIKIWDIATGRLLKTLVGHIEGVNSVCFSPDGRYILSGSWDSTIKLWEVATGRLLKTIGTEKKNSLLPPLP